LRFLRAKKAEQSVVSSSGFFLITLLLARRLASETPPRTGADELSMLRTWGSILSRDWGEKFERLVRDFFEEVPFPSSVEFAVRPETTDLISVSLGPGLNRTLVAFGDRNRIDVATLLAAMINDQQTGIARRLRDSGLEEFVAALTRAPGEDGRQSRMVREAEPDELTLGVHDFALALGTILRTATGEFTFALFGRWGSGKTTLVSVLEPLLTSPDHYRKMARLKSGDAYAGRRYDVVRHNAWKYRTPPEAWIYIYKSLADSAAACFGFIDRTLLALRTSIERKGCWPIAVALIVLALTAVPLEAKYQLGVLAASVIGFSIMLHVAALTAGVSAKVRELFSKHLRLTSSDEKLGMLALIGDDVRALIKGWTSPAPLEEYSGKKSCIPWSRFALPLAIMVAISIMWAVGLMRASDSATSNMLESGLSAFVPRAWLDAVKALLGGHKHVAPTAADWFVWASWTCLSFLMLLVPNLPVGDRPDRILLVVDDLDRCTPVEMLAVIEGVKLLLDDPQINSRLQVLMLVDERVLGHAIGLQYGTMIAERASEYALNDPIASKNAARAEVIAEQKEKLFACHLRFAHLSTLDVTMLVDKLAGIENERRKAEERRTEEQRVAREREVAVAAKRSADERRKRAEENYDSVERGNPISRVDLNAPSRHQLPMQARIKTGIDLVPLSDSERRAAEEKNLRIEATNARVAKLSPEQRIADRPDVVAERQKARAEAEAEDRRLESLVPKPRADAPEEEPLFDQGTERFSDAEILELQKFIPKFFAATNRFPSPRAIRALLFKIQLCRLLLQLRFPGRPPQSRSIQSILEAFTTASNSQTPIESEAVTIAGQVI
jgi:hypothetical protein